MEDSRTNVLWLMPTDFERRRFLSCWDALGAERVPPAIRLCGFGPISAGIVTAQWLGHWRPSEVILLGIGGSYDPIVAPVGSVVEIGRVATDTVGAQRRSADMLVVGEWELPTELGFPQVPEGLVLPNGSVGVAVRQELELASTGVSMLTVGVASGSSGTAQARRAQFPGVAVEDMEGFAVALACRLAGVPCSIVRGLTNEVGDRNYGNWQIDKSLDGLVRFVLRKWGGTREGGPWF